MLSDDTLKHRISSSNLLWVCDVFFSVV